MRGRVIERGEHPTPVEEPEKHAVGVEVSPVISPELLMAPTKVLTGGACGSLIVVKWAGAAVAGIPTTVLMSHPGLELVTPSRVPMAPTTQA